MTTSVSVPRTVRSACQRVIPDDRSILVGERPFDNKPSQGGVRVHWAPAVNFVSGIVVVRGEREGCGGVGEDVKAEEGCREEHRKEGCSHLCVGEKRKAAGILQSNTAQEDFAKRFMDDDSGASDK